MADNETLRADMMKLQRQDEEDQLRLPSRTSPYNQCLTPNEPNQSTLSYTETHQHDSQPSVTVLAIAFMEGVKVSKCTWMTAPPSLF